MSKNTTGNLPKWNSTSMLPSAPLHLAMPRRLWACFAPADCHDPICQRHLTPLVTSILFAAIGVFNIYYHLQDPNFNISNVSMSRYSLSASPSLNILSQPIFAGMASTPCHDLQMIPNSCCVVPTTGHSTHLR